MYAIVEIAGQQIKVEKDQRYFVNRLKGKEGEKVVFDNVLLFDDGKKVRVGDPKVSGASVKAKILKHCKGDKIIVFKKKRRKGYRVKNGHRQNFTMVKISKFKKQSASKPKKESSATDEKKTTTAKKKADTKKESK